MPNIDPFASITGAVLDLLLRDGDLFLSLGVRLFRGFAILVIVWFGLQVALTSGEGRTGVSFGLLKLVDRLVGLRPDPESEHEGLDVNLHGEQAYGALDGSSLSGARVVRESLHEADGLEPAGERDPVSG